MNNRLIHLAIVVTVLLWHFAANAYELGTHARITYKAYEQSVLNKDSQLIKDLGIDLSDPNNPFGTQYYDISDSDIRERDITSFEDGYMNDRKNPNPVIPIGTDPRSLPGWLLRGDLREADVPQPDNGQPVDDPYNTGNVLLDNRVLNHFYDPVHNWPLTVGVTLGKRAPDWASGTNDVFNQPNTPKTGRRNHFTVFDAREAMYRALTGKKKDNTDAGLNNQPATEADRKAYWATLFRALGDIVHLVEDMAQPQHTRNDPHAGKGGPIAEAVLTGHKSLYEAYIETRAAAKAFELPSGDKFIPPPLTYDGYATLRFTDYLSYSPPRHKEGDLLKRQGLADYSNRGFFSAGQNLNPFDAQYDYPSNNAPSYGRQPVEINWVGNPFGGTMTLFTGTVTDSLTGQNVANVPLTAIGAWDQFLEQKNLFARYTLVRENYDAQADLLIPRAVAYSAGLIDYFFRGRIEAEDAHYTEADTRRTT